MIRFENILEKVRAYHPDGDMELLRRAYVFSAWEHRGQLRKSGEPYLIHPLEVANILAEMKLDVVSVVGGLLHDVVEDTLTTTETVEEYFAKGLAVHDPDPWELARHIDSEVARKAELETPGRPAKGTPEAKARMSELRKLRGTKEKTSE